MDYNKNFLIVGMGASGAGVAEFLKLRGCSFDIAGRKKTLRHYDYAVVSPGICMQSRVVKRLKRKKVEIIGELKLLEDELAKNTTIAITGTNGKTTTTYLVAHLLKTTGLNAVAMGNSGESIAQNLVMAGGINVVEVSSYMMEKSPGFAPDIAVLLNLSPDHVKHHNSLQKYYNSKVQMFLNQNADAHSVVNADCAVSMQYAQNFPAQKGFFSLKEKTNTAYVNAQMFYYGNEAICSIKDTQLPGEHNLQNICAAIAVAKILGINNEKITEGLKTFAPVRHRLNFVCVQNGKIFINDSKATNIASTVCALNAIGGQKILILGGLGKGENFDSLFAAEKYNVCKAVCYGKEGKKIMRQIRLFFDEGAVCYIKNFALAVKYAAKITQSGQVCMLSPACASFDQHKNFEHRGNEFESIVTINNA